MQSEFTVPYASIKDAQATGETFSPQKRTSSTSKHENSLLFSIYVVNFSPPGSGSGSGSGTTTMVSYLLKWIQLAGKALACIHCIWYLWNFIFFLSWVIYPLEEGPCCVYTPNNGKLTLIKTAYCTYRTAYRSWMTHGHRVTITDYEIHSFNF